MSRDRPFSLLGAGLFFAFVSALLVVQPLAAQTYLRLFYPEADQLIQLPPAEGQPIPRALVWNPSTFNLIGNLGRMTSAAVLGLHIGLACLLVYGLLRVLNPTFRMTSGVDWDKTLLTRTYMHTPPLIKAFLIAVTAFLPAFLFWHALGYLLGNGFGSLALRLAAIGAAFFVLFSRDGVAGDYDSGNYELPRERPVLLSLLARGALAGLVGALIVWLASLADPDRWLLFYRTFGPIGESNWWRLAAIVLGFAGAIGFAGGVSVAALGAPNLSRDRRLRSGLLAVIALAALMLAKSIWVPGLLQNRYDYVPGSAQSPEERLAALTGVRMTPAGVQTALVFGHNNAFSLKIPVQSIVGLDGSREAARRIESFLKRRDYATALADPAFKAIHDAASLSWDPVESLRIDYLNLTRCPDSLYLPLFVTKLQSTTVAPAVRQYADLLADENRFVFPDRDSLVQMGDTYARLGERDKAEPWYRRAQLPESQIGARLAERTMFADGRITGRIVMNGRPIAGAWIALMPDAARRDIFRTLIAPGVVRPFWLRWITASVPAAPDGRFAFDHVIAGLYKLVLLSDQNLAPPFTRLPIVKGPLGNEAGEIFVGFGKPATELGTIEVTSDTEQRQQTTGLNVQ